MPGDWLLAIANALLDAAIVTDVVEPTVADLRTEWLRAGADSVARLKARGRGYFAFWSLLAMSPFAFRRWPGRHALTVPFWQIQRSHEMTRRAQIQLVTVLAVVGLAGGYAVARLRTPRYQASAVIQIVPATVRSEPGFTSATSVDANRDSRLRAIVQIVLSRTRLEGMILEFNLYERERRSLIMEDVVQRMRDDLDVDTGPGGTLVIKYTGTQPMTVMKVTERLAAFFKDQGAIEHARLADDGLAYLESRIDETATRIQKISLEAVQKGSLSRPRQLELEVIEASYKNLLMRREDALAAVQMERRQLGEQFVLVDAARLPEQPVGISRLTSTLLGGGLGLTVAVLIMVAAWVSRVLRARRADLARRRALT